MDYLIQDSTLIGIAGGVRDISGETENLSPAQMTTELGNAGDEVDDQNGILQTLIQTIETKQKGEPTLQSKTVSPSTSQQVVEADDGYDGLDTVTVNAMRLQTYEFTPEANIGYEIKPDTGYDGLSMVTVNPMPLQDKTITENGSYTPDEGYEAFGSVNVNVVEKSIQANITPTEEVMVAYPSDYGDYNAFSSARVGAIDAQNLSVTSNGTYSRGNLKYYKTVTVNVPQRTLTTKTITANGTYTPSGYDGFSQVTVAIPTYDGTVV